MRLARILTVATLAAALSVTAAMPAQAASKASMVKATYLNAAFPPAGSQVFAVMAWPKGYKVTLSWGDGASVVLPKACQPSTASGKICTRVVKHAYSKTGPHVIRLRGVGLAKSHSLYVTASAAPAPPAPAPSPSGGSSSTPVNDPGVTPFTPNPGPTVSRLPGGWESDLLSRVNAERAAVGSAPLSMCAPLVNAAQGYADQMAATMNYSHTGTDGSTVSSRIAAQGYSASLSGENIAASNPSVDSVMSSWVSSPDHLASMRYAAATHVGFGVGYSADVNGIYWVMDLAAGGSC